MDLLRDGLLWLLATEQYAGPGSIPQRILEHLYYTGVAVAIAAVIAVPIGYFIGHTGRGGVFLVGIAGAARALPSFGLILLLVLLMGVTQRETAAIIALVLLGELHEQLERHWARDEEREAEVKMLQVKVCDLEAELARAREGQHGQRSLAGHVIEGLREDLVRAKHAASKRRAISANVKK